MALITPTATGLRWGPRAWQLYDYWAHPTRVDGGNPLMIFRHGGGGLGGDYTTAWNSTLSPYWYFFQYLRDAPGTGTRDTYWDIISVESLQVLFSGPGNLPRFSRAFMFDQVLDLKRATSSLKTLGSDISQGVGGTFQINPQQIILAGQSHGASQALLQGITPPIAGRGRTRLFQAHSGEHWYSDSSVRGVVNYVGQIDIRTISGVDQIWFPLLESWHGTRPENSNQWDGLSPKIKSALSYLAYIEAGDTDHYTPVFNLYDDAGNHLHPYGDPATGAGANVHDSNAMVELAAALTTRGLPFGQYLAQPGDWVYHWNSNAPAASQAISSALYAWMKATVAL